MSNRAPERRQLTVMLCDLVGWTALAQRTDAEELVEIVGAYRQRCASLIARHGGTVAQYVGDAILAYFGYPRAHEDDAERAIRAALGIVAAERAAAPAVGVHIGIATGVVVVGDLAGDGTQRAADGADPQGRPEISAVGAALNLAARLQGLAGPGMVVTSAATRALARGIFEYRDLGRHELKGLDEPVQAWEVVGESRIRSRFHALRAPAMTPLVDRAAELEALRRLWESVRAGTGQAVLLASEAGVGKSRLADEVARRMVDRQCLRVWYYCSPHLQSSPLAPVIRQLVTDAGFGERDDEDTKLDKLAALVPGEVDETGELVPLLANLLAIGCDHRYPPLVMSPQRRKRRLLQALAGLLERAAARTRVLLVVEDLHWIDPSSDELLGLIVDQLPRLPVLAIFTARPEFHPHWGDRAHLTQMPLRPLQRSDAITMIESLCAERRVPAGTIARIADRADGLPLFIEDLARDAIESADSRPPGAAGAAIPATLTDSLMSRLDRLGPAKAVAQIGAAIGREFAYELLARVADLPEEDLKEQLYRLVEAQLVASQPSSAVLTYAFKHALVRDAAYSSLLKKGQAALHSRIARVLSEDFPEIAESQPEVLAGHFRAAGEADEAARHLIAAAKLSARRSGFVEAIAQLHEASGLIAALPRTTERVRLALRAQLALGGVYAEFRGFSSAECGAAYAAALELCHELGDVPEIFAVLSGVGSVEITRANFPRCRALAEECLARAARQSARAPFIMGRLLLGGTLFLTAELVAARRELEEALRLYEEERSSARRRQVLYVQDQKSTGLCYLGLTLALLGYPDGGLRAAQSGLAHSRSLGGPHAVNFSLCYLAATHCFRRDARAALDSATESLEMAREQGFATWVGVSQMIRGESLVRLGEPDTGLAELAAGMSAYRAIGAVTYQPFGLALLGGGLAAVGRLDEAHHALAEGLALSARTGERFYLAELLRLKGEVLARSGEPAQAERGLREAVGVAAAQGARLLELRSATSLCRLLEGQDRDTARRELLAPLCDGFAEGRDAADVLEARALLRAGA